MSSVPENQNSLLEARGKLVKGREAAEHGKTTFDDIKKPAGDAEDARSKALVLAQGILRKLLETQDDLSDLDKILDSGRIACVHVKVAAGHTQGCFGIAKNYAATAAQSVGSITGDNSSIRQAAQSSSDFQEKANSVDERAQSFETSFMKAKAETEAIALSTHPALIKQIKELVGKVAAIGQEEFGLPAVVEDSPPLGEQVLIEFDTAIEQVDQYTTSL